MSLSQKIAAALDENTRAYVLPCAVTVEDGPNRLTLNLTALDTVGVAFDSLEFVATDRPGLVVRSPQRLGRAAGRPGHLPAGAPQGARDRRRRRRGPDPQPVAHRARRPARLLRGPPVPAGHAADGALRLRRRHPPAPARPPASSPAKSSSAWPTTSPPARREAGRTDGHSRFQMPESRFQECPEDGFQIPGAM